LSHSVAVLEPEETVRGFSRSVVLPNSGRGVRLMMGVGWGVWIGCGLTVQDDGDFLAVACCEDVVEEG
jgi:hypothetical protein